MSTSFSWPLIGGTTYSVPATGELNWQALSNYLIALGAKAQSVTNTKLAIRIGTTSPVTLATASDCVIITDLITPGPVAVVLPVGVLGQTYFVVDGKGDAASNNITITPNGAELINGAATYVINKNRSGVVFSFNGTGWTILAEFTNIASGTIPRSSIAAGTPNAVVINDGSGNLSSEAQLAKSRGGTGADNSSVTFPSTGIIVTEAGTETLTNKTIDDDNNVIQNVVVTAFKTVIGNALKFFSFDGSGAPIATKAVPTGDVVGTSDAQVLTAKDYDGGTASNTSRETLPKNTTGNLNALTRKQATLLYDTSTDQVKYDNGSTLTALATAANSLDSILDRNNYALVPSVAANALTIALKTKSGSADPSSGDPVVVTFRSATITAGSYTAVSATAATAITIPSSATLGLGSLTTYYFYVYALNNAGALELAVSATLLDENVVQTSTTIGAGSTSLTGIYSTTGRTSVPFRFLGRMLAPQTIAGTWANVPTEVSTNALGNSLAGPYKAGIIRAPNTQIWVIGGNGYGSTAVTIRRFTSVQSTQGAGVTYQDSATAGGSFTINDPGVYAVNYQDNKSGSPFVIGVSKNASSLTASITTLAASQLFGGWLQITTTGIGGVVSCVGICAAGDIIRAQTDSGPNDTGTNAVSFRIIQLAAF